MRTESRVWRIPADSVFCSLDDGLNGDAITKNDGREDDVKGKTKSSSLKILSVRSSPLQWEHPAVRNINVGMGETLELETLLRN